MNFDGITYAKGASVSKATGRVGRPRTHLCVVSVNYFKKHQWRNTELKDLLVELEAESGRDLKEWSSLWLETAGVNTLRPEIEVGEDGRLTKFDIVQTAIAGLPIPSSSPFGCGHVSACWRSPRAQTVR